MSDIKITGLNKSFDKKAVLTDFSAVIKEGEITSLTAPSGMGKTTLLRILAGLEKKDSGIIEGLSDKKISAVFQEDRLLLNLDAVSNIRLVNSKISREEAEKALQAVGLKDALHKKTEEFSGGMRRRTAILRALMAEYDLLLLDEPFRGLDDDTKKIVMEDTLHRCRGKTVLLVTHDISELDAMGIKIRLKL